MIIPTIQSLQDERYVKTQMKESIFNVVLNKCVEKILYTNRHSDQTYIIFEVPKILIGHPSYDLNSCILFLMKTLRQHNYIVDFMEPFYLYIDWGSQCISSKPSSDFAKKIKKELNKDIDPSKTEKLKHQTKKLLEKYPDASKVVYVFEDGTVKKKKKK